MKIQTILLYCCIAFGSIRLSAQLSEVQQMPSVNVKDLQGRVVSTHDFNNDGKPYFVNFWATWCKPCVLELNTIAETYEDWQAETGIKIIAISIDDARNSVKVAPFINGKGWDYDVYIDENSDLKRALNVNNVPHTFLINAKGEIVWQHNSYTPGDEETMYETYKALLAGKPLTH